MSEKKKGNLFGRFGKAFGGATLETAKIGGKLAWSGVKKGGESIGGGFNNTKNFLRDKWGEFAKSTKESDAYKEIQPNIESLGSNCQEIGSCISEMGKNTIKSTVETVKNTKEAGAEVKNWFGKKINNLREKWQNTTRLEKVEVGGVTTLIATTTIINPAMGAGMAIGLGAIKTYKHLKNKSAREKEEKMQDLSSLSIEGENQNLQDYISKVNQKIEEKQIKNIDPWDVLTNATDSKTVELVNHGKVITDGNIVKNYLKTKTQGKDSEGNPTLTYTYIPINKIIVRKVDTSEKVKKGEGEKVVKSNPEKNSQIIDDEKSKKIKEAFKPYANQTVNANLVKEIILYKLENHKLIKRGEGESNPEKVIKIINHAIKNGYLKTRDGKDKINNLEDLDKSNLYIPAPESKINR